MPEQSTVFYQPASPIRIVAVPPGGKNGAVHEVPVLACYCGLDGEREEHGFMVLDDRDRIPVRLENCCWSDSDAKLIVGPANNPPEWWETEIARARGRQP